MFSNAYKGITSSYNYLWGAETDPSYANNDDSSNTDSKTKSKFDQNGQAIPVNTESTNSSSSSGGAIKTIQSQIKRISLKVSSNNMDDEKNDSHSANSVRNYYSNSIQKTFSPRDTDLDKDNGNGSGNGDDAQQSGSKADGSSQYQSRLRGSAILGSSHSLSVIFENESPRNMNSNSNTNSHAATHCAESKNNDNESNTNTNTNANTNGNPSNSNFDGASDPFKVTHYVFGGYCNQSTSMSPTSANIPLSPSNHNKHNSNNNHNNSGHPGTGAISAFDAKFDKTTDKHDGKTHKRKELRHLDNSQLISNYFDTMGFTKQERKEIESLHNWVKQDKLSMKMAEQLCLGDLILCYFSSSSKTNPDAQGCWKRWIQYRHDNPILKDVNYQRIKEFCDSGVVSIGHGYDNKPFIIINTQYYDDSFGCEVVAKAMLLVLTSCLWDLKKDEFNFAGLRHGVSAYINLSHWSVNMMSWRILKAVKAAVVAFPYATYTSYVVNAPTLIYLVRQFAAKVLVPHAIDKFQILSSMEEFYDLNIAPKNTFPVECGGTSRVTATKWMKDRGYLECIESDE